MNAFTFRLIIDGAHDGASNMARDEAMLTEVALGAQPPTLRFYAWSPPAISLGTSQRITTVETESCARDGVGVVRRSTGGLAILHTDEFTYSIALPITHPLAEGDVLTSYRRISEAIIEALVRLGVRDAQANRIAKEDKAQGPVCFEAPSDYEVVGATPAGLKKLVGSAQWRRVDGVLQHGSLPLHGDIARVCVYLVGAPLPERVRERAATLAEAVGAAITWHACADAWRSAFSTVLGIDFVDGELSAAEIARANTLLSTKYANGAWTARR